MLAACCIHNDVLAFCTSGTGQMVDFAIFVNLTPIMFICMGAIIPYRPSQIRRCFIFNFYCTSRKLMSLRAIALALWRRGNLRVEISRKTGLLRRTCSNDICTVEIFQTKFSVKFGRVLRRRSPNHLILLHKFCTFAVYPVENKGDTKMNFLKEKSGIGDWRQSRWSLLFGSLQIIHLQMQAR